MKVSVTSVAPIGFIEVFEDGSYKTGPYDPGQATRQFQSTWLKGKYDVVPLGELLPLLDFERMAPIADDRRSDADTGDTRVPELLKSLTRPPKRRRDEFWHAALMAGYYELVNPSPNFQKPDTPVRRRLVQTMSDTECDAARLIFDETGLDEHWTTWTGYAEISLGTRGFFRMELHAMQADSSMATHVQMLNLFSAEVTAWGAMWGKRIAPDVDSRPFTIHIDKAWVEDRGVVEKGCVAFHLDRHVDEALLSRAISAADGEDAQLESYDTNTMRGTWFLCDASSNYKGGDVVRYPDHSNT